MKVHKLVYLTALTATTLSLVGCNKDKQRVTPIPGYGMGKPVGTDEKLQPPIDSGQSVAARTPVIPSGDSIPLGTGTDKLVPSTDQPFKSDTVYFEYDKSTIKATETAKLDHIAQEMKNRHGKGLRIEGHCDERGTEEYNRSLGDRRALSIREYLVRAGMSAEMVDTVSYGEDRPVESGHTEMAFSKNRRGEFILLEPPK